MILSDFWRQIPNAWEAAGWNATPPPSSDVDSFYQYYSYTDSKQLLGYIIKGSTIWSYGCKDGYCAARYVRPLESSFKDVFKKYRWNFDEKDSFWQVKGVSDWGMNATFQKSAFSSVAYLNSEDAKYYENLLTKQKALGYDQHPNMPVDYVDGQWVWNPLRSTIEGDTFAYLSDGWDHNLVWRTPETTIEDYFILIPAENENRINATWTLNILSGKNHAMAYLLYTNNKILKPF